VRTSYRRFLVRSALGAAALTAFTGSAWAQETMKIGLLATL
jgi:branched-chain amino acid transport system substrate-binding protein